MASKPGVLTEWPWRKLGNFKYVILAPWVAHSIYMYMREGEKEMASLCMFPILVWRCIHSQIWISLARFQTGRGSHLIVPKGIEFEQVDRERNWDDQIMLTALLGYVVNLHMDIMKNVPLWRADGAILVALLHAGPVEFLYYWLHRVLHHHLLYSRYHSHHHSSIVTEPITSVIHPFAEILAYFILFSIPIFAMGFTGTISISVLAGYLTYVDFMNNMGHCNFEFIPQWLFMYFPFLKYFMYTPSFHSLHHTQFRTNYCLFMPIYDYIYGTIDKSSDALYQNVIKAKTEAPNVIHLTHPTTLQSIYHLRLGFAELASKPYSSKWFLWMLWPVTRASMFVTWILSSSFTVERNKLDKLNMQTWAIPRFSFQYSLSLERASINDLIEKAILEAEGEGVKVISLGLLNQGEELNRYGELYLQKHPKLKTKIVDGSSLAVAIVLNSIPQKTSEILLRGNPWKVAHAIALALCQNGTQVIVNCKDEYEKLHKHFPDKLRSHLVYSNTHTPEVWIVGDGLGEDEQNRAKCSTQFIPFSQFPLNQIRTNCIYFRTPAMMAPKAVENMHACENWLLRRAMSASRVAGIVHALEGWDVNECGNTMLDVQKVWDAALKHGFRPFRNLH